MLLAKRFWSSPAFGFIDQFTEEYGSKLLIYDLTVHFPIYFLLTIILNAFEGSIVSHNNQTGICDMALVGN